MDSRTGSAATDARYVDAFSYGLEQAQAPPAAGLHRPLSTDADKVPVGDGWLHELKHDGFRILAFKAGDTVRLWSRNGRDWSHEFVAGSVQRPNTPDLRLCECRKRRDSRSTYLGEKVAPSCMLGKEHSER